MLINFSIELFVIFEHTLAGTRNCIKRCYIETIKLVINTLLKFLLSYILVIYCDDSFLRFLYEFLGCFGSLLNAYAQKYLFYYSRSMYTRIDYCNSLIFVLQFGYYQLALKFALDFFSINHDLCIDI